MTQPIRIAAALRGLGAGLSLFLVVIGFAVAGYAQEPTPTSGPIQVEAKAEPRDITIGDPVRYTVEVTSRGEAEIRIPVLAGTIGDFTIVDFGELPTKRSEGLTTTGRWYTLTTFETGDQLIPAPSVEYRVPGEAIRTASGEDVLVVVKSLLAVEPEAKDIRDIVPPEPIPFDWTPYFVLAGLIVLGLLVIAAVYYLVNRPRGEKRTPPRPAHEVALEELAKLRGRGLVDAGEIGEFYVSLTRIVRTYLEDGFHVRAPEMTTEEFLATAGSDSRLSAPQRRLLSEFLSQADLVKFARFVPTPRDCEAAFEAARRFVEETKPRQVEKEASGASA